MSVEEMIDRIVERGLTVEISHGDNYCVRIIYANGIDIGFWNKSLSGALKLAVEELI